MAADAALLFFGLAWALLGRRSSTSPPQPAPPDPLPPVPSGGQVTSSPPHAPPPWPQTVPAGLPSFPSGWEFDEPPPLAVQQRARAILQSLWDKGAGTWKAEQTAGRWIVYRAEIVSSGKKGVVAYRPKASAAPAATRRPQTRATRRPPAAVPSSPSAPQLPPTQVLPTSAPSSPSSPDVSKLPLLQYGSGLKPAAADPNVKAVQRMLGFPAARQDGRFGGDTQAAVKLYQRNNGLKDDGKVGPQTWASLYAVRA